MMRFQESIKEYDAGVAELHCGRDELDELANNVIRAAKYHFSNSHITITHADGSAGRKEVIWNAEEQRFTDWGNNFWLYGPDSLHGNGKWVIGARHDHEVIVAATLNRSKHASKFGLAQRLWVFYWQLLFNDVLQHNYDSIVDLHINPLEVDKLEPKPAPRVIRMPDRILV